MAFTDAENRMIESALKMPPDYDEMLLLLQEGADINAVYDQEEVWDNLLSTIIIDSPGCEIDRFRHDWKEQTSEDFNRYLPETVQFFLDHGFDVNRYGGKAGAACLDSLRWTAIDRYGIAVLKMLLEAGCNPDLSEYDSEPETVLQNYSEREGEYLYDSCGKDCEIGSYFYILVEIVNRFQKGTSYSGLGLYDESYGKRITGVGLINWSNEPVMTEKMISWDGQEHQNGFEGGFVVELEESVLVIVPGCGAYTDLKADLDSEPYMVPELDGLKGSCISKITFHYADIPGYSPDKRCSVRITADNGMILTVGDDFGEKIVKGGFQYWELEK